MMPQQIGQFVQRWFEDPLTSNGKIRGAQLILQKLRDANYERRVLDRPWYTELITYLQNNG